MTIEWNQFIPNIISTFLGAMFSFILAIIGQKIAGIAKRNNEIKYIIRDLKIEFNNIFKACSINVKYEEKVGNAIKITYTYKLSPIKTPIWDSLINTNKIGFLSKRIYYIKIFNLYSYVREYNDWYKLLTSLYFNNIESKESCRENNTFNQTRDKLCAEIDGLSEKIKKLLEEIIKELGAE